MLGLLVPLIVFSAGSWVLYKIFKPLYEKAKKADDQVVSNKIQDFSKLKENYEKLSNIDPKEVLEQKIDVEKKLNL